MQVKSTTRPSNIPFSLIVRDPSSQIDTLNENKKFAENVSESLKRTQEKEVADYKFNVTVPKQETYFPLLKYKCTGDLRPVPIVSIYIVPKPFLRHIVLIRASLSPYSPARTNKGQS